MTRKMCKARRVRLSKKEKHEDEKREGKNLGLRRYKINNAIFVFILRYKLSLKLGVRLPIMTDDAVRRAIDDVPLD
jgi:hypothetical protein